MPHPDSLQPPARTGSLVSLLTLARFSFANLLGGKVPGFTLFSAGMQRVLFREAQQDKFLAR